MNRDQEERNDDERWNTRRWFGLWRPSDPIHNQRWGVPWNLWNICWQDSQRIRQIISTTSNPWYWQKSFKFLTSSLLLTPNRPGTIKSTPSGMFQRSGIGALWQRKKSPYLRAPRVYSILLNDMMQMGYGMAEIRQKKQPCYHGRHTRRLDLGMLCSHGFQDPANYLFHLDQQPNIGCISWRVIRTVKVQRHCQRLWQSMSSP